jgi:PhoPQ-activated pathogenicity-related protein
MEDDDTAGATLLDAVAASAAARGVCFHNAHPAPRRFLPLRAPALYAAARGRQANAEELSRNTAPGWAVMGGRG